MLLNLTENIWNLWIIFFLSKETHTRKKLVLFNTGAYTVNFKELFQPHQSDKSGLMPLGLIPLFVKYFCHELGQKKTS